MGWNIQTMTDFIGSYLGPTLESNGYGQLKLMILDDQRLFIPFWPRKVIITYHTHQLVIKKILLTTDTNFLGFRGRKSE